LRGYALHALVPSIPLAAAFALGAALGPTDAAAVTALSSSVSLKGGKVLLKQRPCVCARHRLR